MSIGYQAFGSRFYLTAFGQKCEAWVCGHQLAVIALKILKYCSLSIVPCPVFLLLEKRGQKAGWRPGNEAIVLYEVLKGASIAAIEFGTNCCH